MVFDLNVSGEVTIYQKGFIEKLIRDYSDIDYTAETSTTSDSCKINGGSVRSNGGRKSREGRFVTS